MTIDSHGDCASCAGTSHDTAGKNLRKAPGSDGLRGSRFVGSRGVRDLFVCRRCGALWWTWIDKREGWQSARCLGRSAVPIFAVDTNLRRIVEWVVSEYREEVFRPVHDLARIVIRRKPDGLQSGVDSILEKIAKLARPDSDVEAERLTMIFRVLGLVIDRTVRGDLRPPGPRVRPPRRWTDEDISEEAERFTPGEVDGLARLAFTHDVLRRLLWERRFGRGAASPETAVVAIHDVSPIVDVVDRLPFERVEEGTRRGVFAAAVYEATSKLVNMGLLPENDHAFWMREEARDAVRHRVDPVIRLAGSARRLSSTSVHSAAEACARMEMEAVLVRVPIERGARFTDDVRSRLESIRARLDDGARRAMDEILKLEREALSADSRCGA